MDAKITLSFDAAIIEKAKQYAETNQISLSRLIEFMLSKVVVSNYKSLDEIPVSDWVHMVSEGEVKYERKPRSNKQLKQAYYTQKAAK